MSGNKGTFQNQYTVVEVIQSKKSKKTSIVRNSKGQYFVAKKFYMSDIYALNEIGLMKTIKHPNIVAFHDIIMEKGHIYLIEEFCEQGDLAYHIKRQIRKKRCYFTEATISKWLLQLLLAIQYLHSKKIMHRDIRPQNIFLTSQGNLKLGCFRSSKLFDNETQLSATVIGSPYYLAPQCLQNRGYDQKVDIWAFGCILYQMCSLKSIFKDKNVLQQANLILKDKNRQLPSFFSKQLVQIYNKCLDKKAKERASAKNLLRQPYFIQEMKILIQERPTSGSNSRVPIRHYNIHFNILANKKKQKDVQSFKQKYKTKNSNKQKQLRTNAPILPKIQQNRKQSEAERPRKSSKSLQRVKTIQSPRAQIKKQRSIQKIRQRSKQIIRKKSLNKVEKQKSRQQTKRTDKSAQKKLSAQSSKKIQKLPTEEDTESPKKTLLPPPILPRPPQKKVQKKQTEKISLSAEYSETKTSAELSKMKSDDNIRNFDKDGVKQSLNKIFQELNLKQEDQQQFSFELEDENLARLTVKPNEGNQLIATYKFKLSQLIQQINYKYCPNMEPIQERTQEFDSNTFASIRKQ